MTTNAGDQQLKESSALAAALEELAPKIADPTQGQQAVAPPPVSRNGDQPNPEHPNPEPGAPGDAGKDGLTLDGVDVAELLKHPVLGPKIQSWADKEVALPQVTSALNRERTRLETEISAKKDEEVLGTYFDSLSKEDLADVLAEDPDMAVAYAKYQEGKSTAASGTDELAVANAARQYAYLTIISATNKRIEEAALPAEVKSLLDPNKFAAKGDAGIVEWVQAVDNALMDTKLAPAIQKALDEKWEAYVEEQSAKGPLRPGAPPPGKAASPVPDLMTTPSIALLEAALSEKH